MFNQMYSSNNCVIKTISKTGEVNSHFESTWLGIKYNSKLKDKKKKKAECKGNILIRQY